SGRLSDRVQEGLGIGLSLVKTLVELHSGRIRVESAGIGQGSVFEISLPIVKEKCESPAAPPEVPVSLQFKRVLVVDDNIDAANTLAQLLTLMGHQVETAYRGSDAMDFAVRFQPDVVFLD